mmetsp:Transcript_12696/g.38287  ORF Transcript_12696/g.38287 Transcript_12696/m.38287 type:complete len:99 (+) Transcript_12696:839-1135(+)
MSSLAAAAAATANDDAYVGLDLPLQTFSCIVGIKLSQATYYLKSTEMVATLLQHLAQHSSQSTSANNKAPPGHPQVDFSPQPTAAAKAPQSRRRGERP